MTIFRAFRLFSESELAHLRRKLDQALQIWTEQWFQPGIDPVSIEVGLPDATEIPSDVRWRRIDADAESGLVGFVAGGGTEMLRHWLVGEGRDNADLDDEWSATFVASLISGLLESDVEKPARDRARHTAENSARPPEADALLQWASGALLAVFVSGTSKAYLLVPPDYVRDLLADGPKLRGGKQNPRVRSGEALAHVPVRLRIGASIEETLSLEAVRGLAVGDVLLLGRKVEEPWQVFAPDGSTVTGAYLGRQDTKHVVRLVAAKDTD